MNGSKNAVHICGDPVACLVKKGIQPSVRTCEEQPFLEDPCQRVLLAAAYVVVAILERGLLGTYKLRNNSVVV